MGVSLTLDLSLRLPFVSAPITLRSEARRLAVVGPSGAGKTTLLRALAGLERRAEGQITVLEQRWLDSAAGHFTPPWQRRAGWVPQEGALFPHQSVRQNLGWAGAAGEAVERVAALLGLDALLDRQPRKLSGGERQRVALGRALLSQPRLLLLDEPLSALDRDLRARVAAALATFCAEAGLPLVLVSHHDADVAALAEQVWTLSGQGLEGPALA